MKVDSKFNKRSAKKIACNYTAVSCKYHVDSSEAIQLKFYGTTESGDLCVEMDTLEAHRLLGQINNALSGHAKVAIKNAEGVKQ